MPFEGYFTFWNFIIVLCVRLCQYPEIARFVKKCNQRRILTLWGKWSILHNKKGGKGNASILREVSYQERNERPQEHNHEERQAGYSGNMPRVRNKDVQNWEGIMIEALGLVEGWVSVVILGLSIW